jgi:hypothetical protein
MPSPLPLIGASRRHKLRLDTINAAITHRRRILLFIIRFFEDEINEDIDASVDYIAKQKNPLRLPVRIRQYRSTIPYSLTRFDLNTYTNEQAKAYFRFTKDEIYEILPHLYLEDIAFRNRYTASPEEAFCLLCYRLSWPYRYIDIIHLFGHWKSWCYSIFNNTVEHLANRYQQLLYFDRERLNLEQIR